MKRSTPLRRTGFKQKLTERGRSILDGTAPKIKITVDCDGEPPPTIQTVQVPFTPRPRTPAPSTGLLAQAMAMNGPGPTAKAIAALMKTPDRKSQRLRDSANGEECLVRIPGCPGDPAMTIWSHAPLGAAGKGKSIKALDLCGAYCCTYCDAVIDGQRPMPAGYTRDQALMDWFYGHMRSLVRARQKGVL